MTQSNLIGREISSTRFHWETPFQGTVPVLGTADWSDVKNLVGQLYNDSCDVGFIVASKKTGKKIIFYLEALVRNEENELCSLTFKSTEGEYTIELFND